MFKNKKFNLYFVNNKLKFSHQKNKSKVKNKIIKIINKKLKNQIKKIPF